jgi:hypothetical protein
MDQFLINKWKWADFGVPFSVVAGYTTYDYSTCNAYFFLRKELEEVTDETSFREAQRKKTVRHCKVYRGKWLDYTIHKEFNTLAEWAADAGGCVDDILYGVNHVYRKDGLASARAGYYVSYKPKYVTLDHLLIHLGYDRKAEVNDTFTHVIMSVLKASKEVPPAGQRCLVKRSDGSIVISKVFDKKFESLDPGSPSKLVVRIPVDNSGNIREYSRLSEIPTGMTIYFYTSEGEFCPINDLV